MTDGATPLHFATFYEHRNAAAVLDVLLAAGADPGARVGTDLRPLHDADGRTAQRDLVQDNPALEATGADGKAAADATPLEPFGPSWIVAENQPCQPRNPDPEPGETVTWSGACVNGKVSGEGRIVWRHSGGVDVYEGEYRDGELNGHGIANWADGDRYEGEWREDKPHGYGTLFAFEGSCYDGAWREGCFAGRGGRWAFVGTTAEACGFE